MKKLIFLLLLSLLIIGCSSKDTGYNIITNNPQEQQPQYQGSGCGVTAPAEGELYFVLNIIESL